MAFCVDCGIEMDCDFCECVDDCGAKADISDAECICDDCNKIRRWNKEHLDTMDTKQDLGPHPDCEKYEHCQTYGYIGVGGECESDGHYVCKECKHLKRVEKSIEECIGCLRPVEMCVCPPRFTIISFMHTPPDTKQAVTGTTPLAEYNKRLCDSQSSSKSDKSDFAYPQSVR